MKWKHPVFWLGLAILLALIQCPVKNGCAYIAGYGVIPEGSIGLSVSLFNLVFVCLFFLVAGRGIFPINKLARALCAFAIATLTLLLPFALNRDFCRAWPVWFVAGFHAKVSAKITANDLDRLVALNNKELAVWDAEILPSSSIPQNLYRLRGDSTPIAYRHLDPGSQGPELDLAWREGFCRFDIYVGRTPMRRATDIKASLHLTNDVWLRISEGR